MENNELFLKIIKSHPGGIFVKIPLAVINGSILPFTMLLTQKIVDSISIDGNKALIYTARLGAVFMLSIFCQHFEGYLDVQIANRIDLSIGRGIFLKCSDIPYINYENTEMYETLGRVLEKYKAASIGILSLITSMIRSVTMFVGIF